MRRRDGVTDGRRMPASVLLAAALMLALALAPGRAEAQQGHRRHHAPAKTASATLPGGYPRARDPYVNDHAGLLTPADRDSVRATFVRLRQASGIHATLLTIESIHEFDTPDSTVEAFATHVFNRWGVGDSIRNDGVLMLVARGDRRVRIELGRGYDSRYDARMQKVIDGTVLPDFRDGQFADGVRDGAAAMARAVAEPFPAETGPAAQTLVDGGPAAGTVEAGGVGAGVFVGLVIGLAVLVMGFGAWSRSSPRKCATCKTEMQRLDEASDDVYLGSGGTLEEWLGSVNYDVWKCATCGGHTVEAYNRWFSGYSACGTCSRRTLSTRTRTLVSATYSHGGEQEVVRDCRNCGFHDVDVIHTPHLTRPSHAPSSFSSSTSSSSGSVSSSGSSGSGFGGGSSSGGGASGSW
jgi:uncharacterized protein